MQTYQQLVQQLMTFLVAQVGKPYSEVPGQNFGPHSYDCQGLCYAGYASVGLTTGPGVGLIGSAAQYNDSTVKRYPPLHAGMQAFFYGGESFGPRPGHTGTVTGVFTNGTYEMINAYDTQMGVIYTTFSTVPGSQDFMGYWGATDPLTYLAPYNPPLPPEDDMKLVFATGPQVPNPRGGDVLSNSYWLVSEDRTGKYALHIASASELHSWQQVLPVLKMTTIDFSHLDLVLVVNY